MSQQELFDSQGEAVCTLDEDGKVVNDTKDEIAKLDFEGILNLKELDGKRAFTPYGNDEAKLMVVVSHPTLDCLKEHTLLGGKKDRAEIQSALDQCGLTWDDIWVTSVVKVGIGAKSKPTASLIKEHIKMLEIEIEHVKPKLIMALGAEAWKSVLHKPWKIKNFTGEIIDCPYGKLLHNIAPFNVYAVDPKKRFFFEQTWQYAEQFINDKLSYTPFTWLYVKDVATNTAILNHYIAQGKFAIGYDAEWLPLSDNKENMTEFQYSMEDDVAIVLDIGSETGGENLELLNTMKLIIEHPKAERMGWNIKVDDKRLIKRGFEIPDETLAFDGMKACQFFSNNIGKALDTGIKLFTNYKPYYVEFYTKLKEHKLEGADLVKMKLLEPELYLEYCAGDAVTHYKACMNMRKAMDGLPEGIRKTYYDVFLPLTNTLMDMELFGMSVDVPLMTAMTVQYKDLFEEVEATIKNLAADCGLEPYNPCHFGSRNELFIKKLKLRPGYYTYKKKIKCRAWVEKQKDAVKKRCSPSTNNKSLSTMLWDLKHSITLGLGDIASFKHKAKIIQAQLDYNRINAMLNKPLSMQGINNDAEPVEDAVDADEDEEPLKASYWTALCSDSKIHTDYFECLNNFRCSSSPNMQNAGSKVFPAIKDVFKRYYADFAPEKQVIKSIRNNFWSGDKDYEWYEVDVSGADLMIGALLARDKEYIHDMRSGNFHLKRAREYFKKPDLDKNKDVDLYTIGKGMTFRITYTSDLASAVIPIQADIYAEQGIWLEDNVILEALMTWKNYKGLMTYRDTLTSMVENQGYIEMERGVRYYFGKTQDFGVKASWFNESLALPIAGELAFFMHDVSNKIRAQLKRDKVWGKYVHNTMYIHDATYYTAHKDLRKDNYLPALIEQIFCHDVKMATGENLGMEMSVSDRWKGEHLYDRETKWSFEKGLWV